MGERAVYAVIMAGGSGTRFWPASRTSLPKQFLTVSGQKSLLEETVDRIRPLVPENRVFIVGSDRHKDKMNELFGNTGVRIVLEPMPRNTAPCVGLAAAHVFAESPDALMIVLPADHYIGDEDGFRNALSRACESVVGGGISTVGIRPSRPETGYGYIKRSKKVSEGVYGVDRFVEKPNYETALKYLSAGTYLWNCGVFVLSAKAALDELSNSVEGSAGPLNAIIGSIGKASYDRAVQSFYGSVQSISFDYAVMEKTGEPMYVVPGDFAWSDVGSWQSIYELRAGNGDDAGNVVEGDAITVDCNSCLVTSKSGRLVAAVGLEDVLVVDTNDAVLVASMERSQDVRKVIDELKASRRIELL